MRIPTIFTDTTLDIGAVIALDSSAANHVGNVLRMKSGDQVILINNTGYFFHGSLNHASKKNVTVKIETKVKSVAESSLYTHLGQAMSRGDRMDYAIQKSTEMGVSEITPLTSERCELKLKQDREEKRLAHWQQVAVSAAEQCGRAIVPKVNPVCSLEEWLEKQKETGLSLVFHHRETQSLSGIQSRPEHVNLLIGPEGGLSETEIELAKAANFQACTFGPRVMRTETAPVACLSILQWLWGDFQQDETA